MRGHWGAESLNNCKDLSRVISRFHNSAKQTPQSSYLLDFPKKVHLSELSNFSRKSSRKLYQKPQMPKKKSSFGSRKQKRAKQKNEKGFDLRFMNSDLESDFSMKNSVKGTSNLNSSFQIGYSKSQQKNLAESSKIHKEFVKNFPEHGKMSPTSRFQNKFFARKNE